MSAPVEELPASLVVGVGDGVAFGQDGEPVGRDNARPADWIKATQISLRAVGGMPVEGIRLCSPSCRP